MEKFEKVEIIEHYNTYYKFRVPRSEFTIGYLFGYMQELAQKFHLSEYSASQTTLEQIFNVFAQEGEENRREIVVKSKQQHERNPDSLERVEVKSKEGRYE